MCVPMRACVCAAPCARTCVRVSVLVRVRVYASSAVGEGWEINRERVRVCARVRVRECVFMRECMRMCVCTVSATKEKRWVN